MIYTQWTSFPHGIYTFVGRHFRRLPVDGCREGRRPCSSGRNFPVVSPLVSKVISNQYDKTKQIDVKRKFDESCEVFDRVKRVGERLQRILHFKRNGKSTDKKYYFSLYTVRSLSVSISMSRRRWYYNEWEIKRWYLSATLRFGLLTKPKQKTSYWRVSRRGTVLEVLERVRIRWGCEVMVLILKHSHVLVQHNQSKSLFILLSYICPFISFSK